jgi:hypothetical protein
MAPNLMQDYLQLVIQQAIDKHCPKDWKVAKIVPLMKGGKDDYTLAKNSRPISLSPTLGKVLEPVVANRIGYLTEIHGVGAWGNLVGVASLLLGLLCGWLMPSLSCMIIYLDD